MNAPKTFRAYVNKYRSTPCWKEKIDLCVQVIKDEKIDKELRKKAESDLMTIGAVMKHYDKEVRDRIYEPYIEIKKWRKRCTSEI